MNIKIFDHYPLENLDFDLLSETTENGRFYITPQGNKYRSVTTVLGELNKKAILEWKNRIGHEQANKISNVAANKGTKYHGIIEEYLKNNLTEDKICSIIPEIKQMFLGIKPYLDKNISKIYGIEKALYSDELMLAGRVDLIAEYNGLFSIVDHKTSSKPKKEEWITNYFYQTAIYAKMVEERIGTLPEQIIVAIAVTDNFPQVYVKRTRDYLPQAIEFVNKYHQGLLTE